MNNITLPIPRHRVPIFPTTLHYGLGFSAKIDLGTLQPQPLQVGWLVGWLAGWLAGWLLADSLAGCWLTRWLAAGWLAADWLVAGWLAAGGLAGK